MPQLDKNLVFDAKRAPIAGELTKAERIAINLFWRKEVSITVLAKIFGHSRNTIYYWCCTGEAPSYPRNNKRAREINDLVEEMGPDAAWEEYVTPGMIESVEAALGKKIAGWSDDPRRDRRKSIAEPDWLAQWQILKVADDGFDAILRQWRRWHWTPIEINGETKKKPGDAVDGIIALAQLGVMPK